MINILLQLICSYLFAVGALFLLIELWTKYDKSFLYFGLSLMILCIGTALDIWILPQCDSLQCTLYWTRIFQIICCCFFVFSIWYLMAMTNSFSAHFMRVWVLCAIAFSILFSTDLMLTVKSGEVAATALYALTVIPYVLCWGGIFIGLNIWKIIHSRGTEKRILWMHFAGILAIAIFGIVDVLVASFIGQSKLAIPSFTIIGVFGFGIMASLIFAERFLMLLKDRQAAYEKLETAYTELEEVTSLKQLGESTAIINHEIRNYMGCIIGLADLIRLKEPLSERGKEQSNKIVDISRNLVGFSEDILHLSRARVVKDKKQINLANLIKQCISDNFADNKDAFVLDGLDKEVFICGNWDKLQHAFVNIFKNAIEAAGAEPIRIAVSLMKGPNVWLIVIDDNGAGCDEKQMQGLFKAFFTTKKGKQGTGLGMSITRTIIEGHGGRISAYSKNLQQNRGRGLVLQIALPRYAQEPDHDKKDAILLVKEGLDNLESVIRVFQNVAVNPHVLQDIDDIDNKSAAENDVCIVGNSSNISRASRKYPLSKRLYVVSHNKGSLYVLNMGANKPPSFFSEQYVLSHML